MIEPYGDWRDVTIAEALHWLKIQVVSLLLRWKLIEDDLGTTKLYVVPDLTEKEGNENV